MARLLSVFVLGLALIACDDARDRTYYEAHPDEAKAKVATCSKEELKSDRECTAAADVRATILIETRRAMIERVCGLLTDAEAAAFVGVDAAGRGAATPEVDTSECDWGPGVDLFVHIEIAGPRSFAPDTAAKVFDDLVERARRRGVRFEEFPDIGDKAILVVDGGGLLIEDASPTIMALTILKRDFWAFVRTYGLSREQTIEAARIAASRL